MMESVRWSCIFVFAGEQPTQLVAMADICCKCCRCNVLNNVSFGKTFAVHDGVYGQTGTRQNKDDINLKHLVHTWPYCPRGINKRLRLKTACEAGLHGESPQNLYGQDKVTKHGCLFCSVAGQNPPRLNQSYSVSL